MNTESPEIKEWHSAILACVSRLEADSAIEIGSGMDARAAETSAREGFPAVLPLWTRGRTTMGLVAIPDRSYLDWPSVLIRNGAATTIAENARTALPQYIVHAVLSNYPDLTESLASRWDRVRESMFALHSALGGRNDTLEPIAGLMKDRTARNRFRFSDETARDFQAAHSEIQRSINRSREFSQFADWLDSCRNGRIEMPALRNFGTWRRQAISRSIGLIRYRSAQIEIDADSLQQVFEPIAGLDTGFSFPESWDATPRAENAKSTSVAAAKLLERQSNADNIALEIAKSLLADDMDYKGYAHSEATATLDEAGDPIRAWGAIQSAAWWAARNAPGAVAPIVDAARFLAAKRRWTDTLSALNYGQIFA